MSKISDKLNSRGLRTSYVSTTVGVSLVLFMISIVVGIQFGFNQVQKQAKESLQVDIFFKPEVNESDKKQIEQELKTWSEFSEVYFVSKERALEELGGTGEDASEILEIFENEYPIDANITFMPKEEFASVVGMEGIKAKLLKEYKGRIQEVSYEEESVQDVNLGFKRIVFLFGGIALLLIVVAVAMINNTIRLALYSKRFSIKTMQLVGATSRYIRKPFLVQAMGIGAISGVIGMALFLALLYVMDKFIEVIEISLPLEVIGTFFGGLVLLGMLLTLLSTFVSLNKFLRMKLDDLY